MCCRNVATNYNSKVIDKRNQTVEISDEFADYTNLEDVVINQIIYNNAIDNHALEKIIESLSESETILYRLKWIDRLSEKQIAEQLDISASAVKNRLMRLHRKIQNKVKEYS